MKSINYFAQSPPEHFVLTQKEKVLYKNQIVNVLSPKNNKMLFNFFNFLHFNSSKIYYIFFYTLTPLDLKSWLGQNDMWKPMKPSYFEGIKKHVRFFPLEKGTYSVPKKEILKRFIFNDSASHKLGENSR